MSHSIHRLLQIICICLQMCIYASFMVSSKFRPPLKLVDKKILQSGLCTKKTFAEGIDFVIEDFDEECVEDTDFHVVSIEEKNILSEVRKIQETEIELKSPIDDSVETRNGSDINRLALHNEGVVRLNKVFSTEQCGHLHDFIDAELAKCIREVENGVVQPLERFSKLLSSDNRWDLKLPLDDESDIVKTALRQMFRKDGELGKMLLSMLTDDCELFELAAFYTAPGANRQVVHADTIFTNSPVLFTVAIALQDVTEEMGPTLFLPATHTKTTHRKFHSKNSKNSVLLKTPHKLALLKAGDASIYDSRVLHCGTENVSDRVRILMYATFRCPKGKKNSSRSKTSKGFDIRKIQEENIVDEEGDDFWNVASIRQEYIGKYKLKDFI